LVSIEHLELAADLADSERDQSGSSDLSVGDGWA
jgi:hypothetical protein